MKFFATLRNAGVNHTHVLATAIHSTRTYVLIYVCLKENLNTHAMSTLTNIIMIMCVIPSTKKGEFLLYMSLYMQYIFIFSYDTPTLASHPNDIPTSVDNIDGITATMRHMSLQYYFPNVIFFYA